MCIRDRRDTANKNNELPKNMVLNTMVFLAGHASTFLPIKGKQNDAINVADEQIPANINSVILTRLQMVGIASDIKNVWPGAEKKMPRIEKLKKQVKTNPQKPSYVGSYYDSTYLDGVQGIALDVRHFFKFSP